MTFSRGRPAQRTYNRRVLVASATYAVLLMGTEYVVTRFHPGIALRVGLALLPALAIIAIFVALGRYLVEESDEYLRARLVRQILWATGATFGGATAYGFLQAFETMPDVPLYTVAILWFLCLGIAGAVLRARGA